MLSFIISVDTDESLNLKKEVRAGSDSWDVAVLCWVLAFLNP